jgi:2-polyprenyl-6-hydroxyphenyl methylase / 3-demethylubiquinone-9 3-methyltransferase
VSVDNSIYDRWAADWWSDDGPAVVLRIAYNPARFGYLRRVIAAHGIDLAGAMVLEVGCGGGLLAEEFARLGWPVVGLDPSVPSIEVARAHAGNLPITYLVGRGEHLPFADAAFDVVYCCDVLEHVADLPRVIAETARVLRPGGLYLFDTINRTLRSRVIAITLAQNWRRTRFLEPNLHAWRAFVKPRDLRRVLRANHLTPAPFTGLAPTPGPVAALRLLHHRAQGTITYAALAEALAFHESHDTSVSYAGHAVKSAS